MKVEKKKKLILKYKKEKEEILKLYHSPDFKENYALSLKLQQIQIYLDLLKLPSQSILPNTTSSWTESFRKELYNQIGE